MFTAPTASVPLLGLHRGSRQRQRPLRPGRSGRSGRPFSSPHGAFRSVLVCALLVWIGGQQVGLGRTWTSHDGRYTVQANFVKLEGEAVTLQTLDNQLRTVRLNQLSAADQGLVRDLARALVHTVPAEAEGIGLSPDDALHDAFARAIAHAVGAEVSARTVIENDELVQDRVLVFSDGFVKDYKDFGCRQEAGLYHRKILAYVQRRDLRSDLADSDEDGNARRLYAEAYTKVRRHRIGMLLLQEALESFNADMLDARLAALGKPEVMPNDLERVGITCRLTVQVRPERYDRVRQRIETVLAAVARSHGHLDVVHRRFREGHDTHRQTVLQLRQRFWGRGAQAAASFGDVYTMWNFNTAEPLPSTAQATARDQGSTLFFVYSPPGGEDAAASGIMSRWRWFEIDDQPPIPAQKVTVVARYTDQTGSAVLEERFPLGPNMPGISVSPADANLRTVLVSPLFLYHEANGYEIKDLPHAPRTTLERKITVFLKTLARVHTAKAVAVADDLERPPGLFPTMAAARGSTFSQGPPLAIAPFDERTAKQHQAAWPKYLGMPVEQVNSIGMTFALIPPGEFVMGSPETEEGRRNDEFHHRVRLTKPFYMGVHEVTQGEYEQVMRSNPSYFSEAGRFSARVAGLTTSRFPVDSVSWRQAIDFCEILSARPEERSAGRVYRLPTEAEWEYACRAGATTPFFCGNELTGHRANIDGTVPYKTANKGPFLRRTTTVGAYEANAFGLYDMHGNVLEWCQDWYDEGYYRASPSEDPGGPIQGKERVIRDGGWGTVAKDCRAAIRCKAEPGFSGEGGLGFRVVAVPASGWKTAPTQVRPKPARTTTQNGRVGTFHASATDLVNRGSQSVVTVELVDGLLSSDSAVGRLNDGDFYGGTASVNSSHAFLPADGTAVLFRLNTAQHANGYDITKIVSITGSAGGTQQRSRQHYVVAVAGVGSDTFVPIATVRNVGQTGEEVEVTTVGENGELLATGVGQVRVTFHSTDCESPESMYREFDIFGQPTKR